MSFIDRLFKRKSNNEAEKENSNTTTQDYAKEIEFILLILENLGLINENKIKNTLSKQECYNDSILKRMMFKVDLNNIDRLQVYFSNIRLGFGPTKLHQIQKALIEIVKDKQEEKKNKEEIIEELIQYARVQVEIYEKTLIKLNQTIKSVEENNTSQADVIALIDYWTNIYKEQELGYPVNLENRVSAFINDLTMLPFGGYGIEEIQKFKDAAYKIVEEGKMNNEESNHTLSRIESTLYLPKRNRYLADVETLKKKLQMINESIYLSDSEKETNKQKTIIEFNKMNGHINQPSTTIPEYLERLKLLDHGGYGEIILDEFKIRTEEWIKNGKNNGITNEEIYKKITAEFTRLQEEYLTRLSKLREKIANLNPNENEQVLEIKKTELEKAFSEEVGHPFKIKEKINNWILSLKDLAGEGYGERVLIEFKEKAVERLSNNETQQEVLKSLKEVRKLYIRLVEDYYRELDNLNESIRKVRRTNAPDVEKEATIEDFKNDFKFNVGYRLNFEKYIESSLEELKDIDDGGYGEDAILQFREEALLIINKDTSDKDKYHSLRDRFNLYEKKYISNKNTFAAWKKLRLERAKEEEKIKLAQQLDQTISEMLPLSPTDLNKYYAKDEETKEKRRYEHNFKVAFKYLAKEEAKTKNDVSIYHERIKNLARGVNPYTDNEINDAIKKLELIIPDNYEDRIIGMVEYINSTLLKQILEAEAYLKKNNISN